MSMAKELSNPDHRVVGTKQVVRMADQSLLKKVYIAKDADEVVLEKLKTACESNRIEVNMHHTMHQIGNACQIDVGSACAAVLKKPLE